MLQMPLNPGETAIGIAPRVELCRETSCIPQHFLTYNHNLNSVETIVADICFDERYPIFVSEGASELFVQIGVLGPDNYKKGPEKLVYGRRWRVEPNLPTSEIIQTVFLALKKAREHELRECFTLRSANHITTPFNGHHDLPLMAQQAERLRRIPRQSGTTESLLKTISFDGVGFTLSEHLKTASGSNILTLCRTVGKLGTFAKELPVQMTIVTETLDYNDILYALMENLIAQSDRFVEEHFKYKGFARFSRNVDVMAIAQMSAQTRQCPTKLIPNPKQAQRFLDRLKKENYYTDSSRVPKLSESTYAQSLKTRLSRMGMR